MQSFWVAAMCASIWVCVAFGAATDADRQIGREFAERQTADDSPASGIPAIPELGARIRDCEDLQRIKSYPLPSGIYEIQPLGFERPFQVFCDFETDGGKWTVIQRRLDGSVNFQRGWTEYKEGFGNLDTEFWLGNEKISKLTSQKSYKLRIELTGKTGRPLYAKYSHFSLADERKKYRLSLGTYSGNSGRDSLDSTHRDKDFSTADADHDTAGSENCAANHGGGWWFGACDNSNLNGRYGIENNEGIEWTGIPAGDYALRFTEMKIRQA